VALMFVVFAIAGLVIAQDSVSEIQPIEQQVVSSRQNIISLEVILTTRFDSPSVGPVEEWESHIWIDGDRAREDRRLLHAPRADGEVPIVVRCNTPDELLYWKTDDVEGKIGMAIHRWQGPELEDARINDVLRFPRDPRFLGVSLLNTGTLTTAREWEIGCAPGLANRHKQTVEDVNVSGQELLLIRFETSVGSTIAIWYDREKDGQPVKLTADFPKHDLTAEVNVEYQLCDDGVTWLPSKVVSLQELKGEKDWYEESDLEVISVNEPVPDSIFTLSSLDIPEKSIQNYPALAEDTYWDGEKESARVMGDPRPTGGGNLDQGAGRNSGGPRIFVLVNLCFVVLIMVYLAFRRRS
ncbi:unnamed protein product, partial [Ostreobium quekettii]